MKCSKTLLTLLSPTLLTLPAVSADAAAKPNIVFIFADDLGYGDLGCYGSKLNRTPHLDKLAQNGIRFTDSYAPAPVCSPSRAGLLTARYPIRAGINGVFFPESFSGIDNSEVLLPEVLKENGYATGIVGKWHLGHLYKHLPLQNGFDEYFGIPYSNDMRSVVYLRGNEVETWKVDQNLITKTYTAEAIKFIERHKDHPFYLYLAHNMPHVPIFASDQFRGKSANGLYGDVIEELDWSVGEIVKTLQKLGLEENTLVVFTSDNGPWLTEGPHGGNQGPLFQGKTTTWDGGQRVPTIAWWKGKIKPAICSGIISHLDWFPTIVTLAGGKMPADRYIDGKSFATTLLNGSPVENQEFYYLSNGKLEAARWGDYKLVLPKPMKKGNFWIADVPKHDTLLFNLRTDIAETTNLYKSHPEKVKELAMKLEQFRVTLRDVPPSKAMTDRSAEDATGSNRKMLIDAAVKKGIKSKSGN